MRVLITGITGFAGSHLAEHLLRQDDLEIFGTMRWRSRMDNLEDVAAQGKLRTLEEVDISKAGVLERHMSPEAVNLVDCDLCDPVAVHRVIEAVKPDRIFHLAAQSFVLASWHAPAQTIQTNVMGQLHLFEAIRAAGVEPRIQIAGSCEQYGLVHDDELPIRESNPFRPRSPYAVSKVTQELLAHQYHWSYGLHTVVTRAFNHTGPRRGHVLVTSSFARQIAEIEGGLREPVMEVGDLTSKRDWTDVRDMVRAYAMALEHCPPGEAYNIASGKATSVQEVLDTLLTLSSADIQVRGDPGRFRPSDIVPAPGDSSRFRALTGWSPSIPFAKTMADLLDYWRSRVGRGPGSGG